jgi:hypothetical protein
VTGSSSDRTIDKVGEFEAAGWHRGAGFGLDVTQDDVLLWM